MTIKVTNHLRFMVILIYPKLAENSNKNMTFWVKSFFPLLENPSGNLKPRELQSLLHLQQTKYGTRSHLVDEEKSESVPALLVKLQHHLALMNLHQRRHSYNKSNAVIIGAQYQNGIISVTIFKT